MSKQKPLDKTEWANHYNLDIYNKVVNVINSGEVQVWAEELLNICAEESKCLEIGCGTGISSIWLAKHGRVVTALDYTDESIELINAVSENLGIELRTICCDATKELPFKEKEFDYIFQAGLLEHFEFDEQISLLRKWKRYGSYMISMIPNASSIPYRVGKEILENSNKWQYGLEIPQHSFAEQFIKAGITVEREYSIGTDWAQKFLPEDHYIRKCFDKLKNDGFNLDSMMQGYLLVTVGRC